MISFEDFKKVEVRAGKILSAEKIPDTDKLLKLSVDFGNITNYLPAIADQTLAGGRKDTKVRTETESEHAVIENKKEEENKIIRDIRQIVSGISMHFPDPQVLVGKKCMFVTNLEPRMIKGYESNGMLFAVSTEDGKFSLLEPNADIPEGATAK